MIQGREWRFAWDPATGRLYGRALHSRQVKSISLEDIVDLMQGQMRMAI